MKVKLSKWQSTGVLAGAVAMGLFGLALLFPEATDRVYSRGLYPYVGKGLSTLSGLFPFTLTDLSLGLIPTLLIAAFVRGLRRGRLAHGLWNFAAAAGAIYAVFLFWWGFNYARAPFKAKFNAPPTVEPAASERAYAEAARLTNELRGQLSATNGCFTFTEDLRTLDETVILRQRELFAKMKLPYVVSGPVKPRLFGELWLSLGNSGIYGPFTGEANVSVPFSPGAAPFVIAHERAHLNGFASETDSNLIAFITVWSGDSAMRYSGWLVFWSYANERAWSHAKLDEVVVRDLLCIRHFWKNRTVPAAKYVDGMYGTYLKLQGQTQGLKTYGEAAGIILRTFAKQGIEPLAPGYGLIP